MPLSREERAVLAAADAHQAWLEKAQRSASEVTSWAVPLEAWDAVRVRISKKLRALRS